MDGYVFRIEDTENPNTIGYEFIKAHPERLKRFSFEESSIDFVLINESYFVVDDIVCKVQGQYFVRVSDDLTNRVLLVKPVFAAKENRELNKKHTSETRYGRGFIPGISNTMYTGKVDSEGKEIRTPIPNVHSEVPNKDKQSKDS